MYMFIYIINIYIYIYIYICIGTYIPILINTTSAPYLWNKLPYNRLSTQSTYSFKSLLKTYRFTTAFP